MNYQPGLVSVVMPTYHTQDYVCRAVDSILQQTYPQIECILVNDNTPQDAYSMKLYNLIARYKDDPRFVFLEQEVHINGAAARNFGIEHAHGEYIAFLDDDDWWKPTKVEEQVAFLNSQSEKCGGVSTLVEFYADEVPTRWMRPYQDGKITKEIMRRQTDVTTCSFLARRAALDDAGYFDPTLKRHQEIQLFTCFSDKYEIKLLPKYLTCCNLTGNKNAPDSETLIRYKKDFFRSIDPVLKKQKKSEIKRIYALHRFELAYVEFKEKKYKRFFCDCLGILRDPLTLRLALKRVFQRTQEYKKPKTVS